MGQKTYKSSLSSFQNIQFSLQEANQSTSLTRSAPTPFNPIPLSLYDLLLHISLTLLQPLPPRLFQGYSRTPLTLALGLSSVCNALPTDILLVFPHLLQLSAQISPSQRPTLTTSSVLQPSLPVPAEHHYPTFLSIVFISKILIFSYSSCLMIFICIL